MAAPAMIEQAPARGAVRPLPGMAISPAEALARWPRGRGLACLWADPEPSGRPWARWTLLAEPTECRTWAGLRTAAEVKVAWKGLGGTEAKFQASSEAPPFRGGWIGFMGYGLGAVIEPAAGVVARDDRGWPQGAWLRCPNALVHDGWTGRWWAVGDEPGLEEGIEAEEFVVGALRSEMGRERFEAAVARAVEYIRAGDVFQVNLSHRMTGAFEGSPRALFREMVARAGPRHGAYLELPSGKNGAARAIVSASPELFLTFEATSRMVTTRPMKGTRAAAAGAAALEGSAKDRAELAMIVDLMRNDLGRVCEFGSIQVAEPRVIERHGGGHGSGGGGVYQGVATVQGRLREGLDTTDLLCATFPGGSVTGAPKIRAMQIIGELEPVARGPYCGAIGMVSDSGGLMLNIAIRTALIADGRLDYSVGAGIVAESEPRAEWAETLDKAGVVLELAARGSPTR